MAEYKDVIVRVKVEGEIPAINALARYETALAKKVAAENRAAKVSKPLVDSLDAVDKAARRSKQGIAQIGQQVQDFGIQVQGGQNPLVAFTQQMAQTGFVMSQMGGTMGAIGGFITGPWGTAIILATSLLVPLIKAISDTDKALGGLNKVEFDALRKELGATAKQMKALGDLTITMGDRFKSAALALKDYFDPATITAFKNAFAALGQFLFTTFIQPIITTLRVVLATIKTVEQWSQGKSATITKNFEDAQKVIDAFGDKAAGVQRLSRLKEELGDTSKKAKETKEKLTDAQKAAIEFAKTVKEETANYLVGGKDIEEATYQLKVLTAVLANLRKLQASGSGDAIVIGGSITKVLEDMRALEGTIDIAKGGVVGLQAEFDKSDLAIRKSQDRLKDLAELMRTTTSSEEYDWAKKQYDAIRKGLIPAIVAAEDAIEAYQLKVSKGVETEQRGGAKLVDLQDQRLFETDKLKELDPTSKAAERVKKTIADIDQAIDLANATPLELKGIDIANEAFKTLEESMTQVIEGTKSVGEAFEDMAKVIIKELVKVIVKWLIVQAITAAFGGNSAITAGVSKGLGFAKGGAFDDGKQLTKYAAGGVVNTPTYFNNSVMGEAGPEAIMPLKRGTDGKLGVGSPPVNIQVVNHNAGQTSVRVEQEADRTMIIMEAVDQARKQITNDIRRGGTSVARSIETTYGMSRAR